MDMVSHQFILCCINNELQHFLISPLVSENGVVEGREVQLKEVARLHGKNDETSRLNFVILW